MVCHVERGLVNNQESRKMCSVITMLSFVNGMSEFLEGEVSLVCRKIILIHGRNPGFYYLDLKRFK